MVFSPVRRHECERNETGGTHERAGYLDLKREGTVVRILIEAKDNHRHVDQIAGEKDDGGGSMEARIFSFIDSSDNSQTCRSDGRDGIRDFVEGAVIEVRVVEGNTLVTQHEESVHVEEDGRTNQTKSEEIAFWRKEGTITDHRKPDGDVSLRNSKKITTNDGRQRAKTSKRGHE